MAGLMESLFGIMADASLVLSYIKCRAMWKPQNWTKILRYQGKT